MSLTDLIHTTPAPRRRMPTWLLPLLLFAGFAGLFLLLLWENLRPALPVEAVRAEYLPEAAVASTAEQQPQEATATLLFRATGWIIPDPLPVAASTYIPGRVAEVPVVEGQVVQQGQLIARLDPQEYELALAHAQGALAAAESAATAAHATLQEAEALLAALREREHNFALRRARYTHMPAAAASEQQRTDAQQEHAEASARTRAQEYALAAARAAADSARAAVRAARAARDKAQLDLERCAITAPISGRILKLNAVPGGRLSPGGETVDMSTAATLYVPQRLALAADVPLDQAGRLYEGQQVRLSCDVFPDRSFTGRVTGIYGRADQTRNTLRCRISISDPDDMLRPDMQCRGDFYSEGSLPPATAPAATPAAPTAPEGDLVRLPEEALDATGDAVWVVSPQGRLSRRRITRDPAHPGAVRGVLPGEPVILHPTPQLRENQLIRITNPL